MGPRRLRHLPRQPDQPRSTVEAQGELRLRYRILAGDIHGTVDGVEDPRGLVDPVALLSRDLMQVAALHKCLDGGMGCRAGHIEDPRDSGSADHRHREDAVGRGSRSTKFTILSLNATGNARTSVFSSEKSKPSPRGIPVAARTSPPPAARLCIFLAGAARACLPMPPLHHAETANLST